MVRIFPALARVAVVTSTLVAASGCDLASEKTAGRWYSAEQVELGAKVYQQHCQSCHNPEGRGTADWKKTLADGSYPPPPLNGTAHTWHHSPQVLIKTINDGGIPLGGKMPPFAGVLQDHEKEAVIAYFQSFWRDDIYQKWSTQFLKPEA